MCLGVSYNLYIKLRGGHKEEHLPWEQPNTDLHRQLSTHSYCYYLLLILLLLLASPTSASLILILTNCGKYPYINLSFYLPFKQDKLGLSAVILVFILYSFFIIFSITQDKITMPQPPHAHRNHPPITPHPKTGFLPDLSACVTNSLREHQSRCKTASLSYLPSQKSLRFLIHHHHLRHTPHYHTHLHTHPGVHTHTHISQFQARLFHFFLHWKVSQSPLVFRTTHRQHNLVYFLIKQMSSQKCITG